MPPAGDSKGFLKGLRKADLSACDEADSFLQSGFCGEFKARFGWDALAFKVQWGWQGESGADGNEEKPILVLHRSLARGISLAYIPWGPELPQGFPSLNEARIAALKELAIALKEMLPRNTAFIRFDPPWYSPDGESPERFRNAFMSPTLKRSGADIQAPDTVLIDLSQSMESLMEQMKPKWRYNARLALKKGVTVRRAGAGDIGLFYRLLEETARRDGIAIHSIDYYESLFLERSAIPGSSFPIPHSSLYLAEHEGDLIAGIITLFRGREAYYLYGASSGVKRNLMAPYALQLKAMEDAKAFGCREYDLYGIPPDDDPSHPMAGLYLFKTGFGGRIIHRPGSWDYPCRPVVYRLFRCAETLRKNFRTIKKRYAHSKD